METIIGSIITGVLSLLGVILAVIGGNKQMGHKLDKQQAVTDTKIDELTREVREHNDFAKKIPVIEEQIKVANHRIDDLESKVS